jgi:hypothetical protein
MEAGQAVQVEVYGGKIVHRIASQVIENKVIIVSEKEWLNSQAEGRQAIGVGYDIEKVFLPNA